MTEDDDVAELEKVCKNIGMSTKEYDSIIIVVKKMLKHMAQEIARASLDWNHLDLEKQQTETRKEMKEKTGIWSDD